MAEQVAVYHNNERTVVGVIAGAGGLTEAAADGLYDPIGSAAAAQTAAEATAATALGAHAGDADAHGAATALAAHALDPDAHGDYLTQAEANGLYQPLGGFTVAEITVADHPYTASFGEQVVVNPDGAITVTLPDPTTIGEVDVKVDDPALGVAEVTPFAVTVVSTGAETIDRLASQIISNNRHNLTFRSTGTRWIIR